MKLKFVTQLAFYSFLSLSSNYLYSSPKLNQSMGNYLTHTAITNGLQVKTDYGEMKISVYSPHVIRVRMSQDGQFDDLSYAVIANPISSVNYSVKEESDQVVLSTDSVTLLIKKKPVRLQFLTKDGKVINEDEPAFGTSWIGEEATTYKKMQSDERFIGLGEKTGSLNRRGEGYTNWNTDYFGYPSGADPIYLSTPFYMGLHHHLQYGIFLDNTYKSHFNFGASNNRFSSFTAEDGEMNYYFIYHQSVAGIIQSYTWLTGRMELPPRWSLGLQQCRYSYYPDKEVLSIARTFRDKSIPADVIYLDIHYMDAYKIFTWHPFRFSNPKKMLSDLKAIGFHTVVIVDPGIKVEKGYASYEQGIKDSLFLKYPDKTFYTGMVWPGWCHFPDFTNPKTRMWWGNSFKGYVDDGIEGFWNDMNEPATWGQRFPDLVEFNFEGKKGTHRRGHNIYGLKMAQSTFEGTKKIMNGKRPFVLTRAGFSGVQRYSAVWTGDNVSSDDHMMSGVRLLNSMGLTGIPFVGMDVGGFTGGPSKELFARWISIGAFSPFFRIHAAIDTKEQEPWSFGERVEEINKNYIQLRYQLMPYIYSTFYESSQTGMPVSRSLAIHYTHDPLIYNYTYQHQYFFGSGIMVAPVESYKDFCKVYLPTNDWYDLYTDKSYKGNEELIVESSIDRLPLFIKGGSIIPMQSVVQHLNEKPSDTLYVHIYKGSSPTSFVYYEDDGNTYQYQNGSYYKRLLSYDPSAKKIVFEKAEGNWKTIFSYVKLVLHGFDSIANIKVNEKQASIQSSYVNFVQPLSQFDPIGKAGDPNAVHVQTIVVPNLTSKLVVSW